MKVVFIGSAINTEKISGGALRFKEAYRSFTKSECELTHNPINISYLNNKRLVFVAFDERYLVRLLLQLVLGRKVLFFPRGNKLVHYEKSYSPFRLYLYKVVFSFLYSRCSLLVFQTNAQYLEFNEMYGYRGNYKVLPNNINTSWMLDLLKSPKAVKYKIASKKQMKVGFLGGLSARKGFDVAYASLYPLIKSGKVVLNVAGEDKEAFKSYQVVSFGKIYDDSLLSFYKDNDIVIIPSNYDSFPNVLLEALAVGCIPLIARTSITEEILGCNSHLLFDRTNESIQELINKIQSNREFLNVLEEECRELANKYYFDWQQRIREVVESETLS